VLLPLCNTAASALALPSGHEVSRPFTKCSQSIVLKSTEFYERGDVVELMFRLAHSCPRCHWMRTTRLLYSLLRSSTSAPAAEPLHTLAAKSGWLGSVFVSYTWVACYGGSDQFLDARSLFDESSTKNNIFGNVILAMFIAVGKWALALESARQFCELGLQVDGYMMTVVV
jgi:hypothetical protein